MSNSTVAPFHGFSEDQSDLIWAWSLAGTILSCLGFLFIVSSFFFIENIRKKLPFRMVMNLALMDMILVLLGIINADATKFDAEHHNVCVSMGFIRTFTACSSVLWTLMFAVTLNDFMFKPAGKSMKFSEIRNYIICYGIPLIVAPIPLLLDSYGSGGLYCWIKLDETATVSLDVKIFYIPLGVVLAALVFYYGRIYWRLRSSKLTKSDWKTVVQFSLYPLSMVICFIFSAMNRFYNLPTHGGSIIWICVLHAFFRQTQVLMNALIYGLNPSVRSHLKKRIGNIQFLKKKETEEDDRSYYSISSTFISSKAKKTHIAPSLNTSCETNYA